MCVTEADNCSACDKCLRTLLTLEVLGVLERYRAVFDLDVYARHRDRFIATVLAEHAGDNALRDLHALLQARAFPIPPAARRRARALALRRVLGRLPGLKTLYRVVRR